MTMSKKMYIGGNLVEGKKSFNIINPANNGVVGSIAWADAEDAHKALNAAQDAFPSWSTLPIEDRVNWMLKLRDALIKKEEYLRQCVHLEMGKSWSDTKADFEMLINSLNFYAKEISHLHVLALTDEEGTHKHALTYEPVGVAVAFLAWNFPLLNLAYKIGPAMAAGCPMVIKPSFKTPLSTYAFGEICSEIGLPPGVLNIVCGDDSEVGDALSASTIPALITLIGSTRTGLHVMKTGSTSIKRYSMELGGNAPALVFADSDLDHAVDIICGLKFSNAGQICVTPNRVYVERSVANEFTQKIVERAKAVLVGFNRHESIEMGPVIDQLSWQRIDDLVKDAIAKGAELLTGGGYPEGCVNGSFYAPTVLSGVNSSMNIYHEEVFGPVISLIEFSDEALLLQAANDTDAGLTAYIFTKNLTRAADFASKLRFGEIQINGVKYAINLPHGGMKQSGIGCDCSQLALHDYLVPKRITYAL